MMRMFFEASVSTFSLVLSSHSGTSVLRQEIEIKMYFGEDHNLVSR